MKKNRWVVVLIALCIFNVLDTLFTWYIVNRFGVDMEANPLIRFVMKMGISYFVVCKVIFLPVAFYLLYLGSESKKMGESVLSKCGLALVTFLYFSVVVLHVSSFINLWEFL